MIHNDAKKPTDNKIYSVYLKSLLKNFPYHSILSCAILPTMDEIQPVFDDFRCKFDGAEIHTITSFDCKKSIPIINKDGFCILPHYMYSDYREIRKCAEYCEQNKTLLRYFDLREIIRFIEYIFI